MSSKKMNGSRKDPLKTPKVWERARREKMKIYFNELQEVLPFYDPSAPMSRFEILQKSKIYIKDLQDQNQELLNGGFDEVYRSKMTKLKQRVKELLRRVDQLTDLLRTANIMIPPLESYHDGLKNVNSFKWISQRPKKWTEKINLVVPDEKIKSVLTMIKDYKRSSGKINLKKKQVTKGVKKMENDAASELNLEKIETKKKKIFKKNGKPKNLKSIKGGSSINNKKSKPFTGSQSPSQFKENQPVDFNLLSNSNPTVCKNNVNSDENTTESERNTSENNNRQMNAGMGDTNKTSVQQKVVETCNMVLSPATNVLPSNTTFILTNDGNLVQLPILNATGTVCGTNSKFLMPTTVVKSNTGLLTPLVFNKPSPVLVLQKSPPQFIQTAQIINSAPQAMNVSKPSIQIFGNSVIYTSTNVIAGAKPLPHILSKAPANKKKILRDSTTTTYVNKIPIPALSKHSCAKKSAPVNTCLLKEKAVVGRTKDVTEKTKESASQCNKNVGECQSGSEKTVVDVGVKEKIPEHKSSSASCKRDLIEQNNDGHKKPKLKEDSMINSEENIFKPIEPMGATDGIFCNLTLPSSINPSLSVSPTAAFLSTFPIVVPSRSETEEEMQERKTEDDKNTKQGNAALLETLDKNEEIAKGNKEISKENVSKGKTLTAESRKDVLEKQAHVLGEKITETTKEQILILPSSNDSALHTENVSNDANKNIISQQGIGGCKTWDQFHHENCEIRSDAFYVSSESNLHIGNSEASVGTGNVPATTFSTVTPPNLNNQGYKTYAQNPTAKANNLSIQNTLNEQVQLKNNHFDYSHKDNYMNKAQGYSTERPSIKKPCTSNVIDSYNVITKTQTTGYQLDSEPNYQLIPAKEASNQRNGRTVNWMTEPDVRNRGLVYASQNDKTAKAPLYTQPDNFYVNIQSTKISNEYSTHFVASEENKINYQKNDFYGKDQRCKGMEKQNEVKCFSKTTQNAYNIFDFNYPGSCYGEEDSSKYCTVQSFPTKPKKNVNHQKKKSEDAQQMTGEQPSSDPSKRPPTDQVISSVDFNPVGNQECFTWVPGKNVEWLPGKSFCLDTNLVVPSTLPTLVGDLALGTTAANNDVSLGKGTNSKICQSALKANQNDVGKDFADLSMSNHVGLPKPTEVIESNKQYLEPFANLSKNIFDVTPSNMHNAAQIPKNDFEKIGFAGTTNNETIVLKNIFELPVSKNSGSDFARGKQRTINNSHNTFLSVSQLVEPPTFEGNSLKNEAQMESPSKSDLYAQNYPNYNNTKTYKSKNRSAHCKFGDRKYHGYKNGSSSYTAEALLRTNTNLNYQPNEFAPEVNANYVFSGKSNQKLENFSSNNKIDFEINAKSDYSTGPGQNIYGDFNFSSPVPNFGIGPTVGSDFGNHDASGNFPMQNNTFFGDFIAPEYPLSESVSNPLLLPPCSIALQNPFVVDKRNVQGEKSKNNSKQYPTARIKKHFDCAKTAYNEFSVPSSNVVFTTASLTCPTIFTTSACQNLLQVPSQSIPISFSSPSFTTSNISFPPLSSSAHNYHRLSNPSTQNSTTTGSFLQSNTMFTTCSSKPLPASHNCYTSNSLTSVTNSVISSPFSVGNGHFTATTQSGVPFFTLSNPIIPSSAPTSSGNSLANFNLSTIFPEINQKGNYHYS